VNYASEGAGAAATILDGSKEQDGLAGPVHRVRTERARLLVKAGKVVEGARELLETTTYDYQGNRIDNSYYVVSANSHTGREQYRYDDQGNVVEMTLRERDNDSILSKEVYRYEFDAVGNWTKMKTFMVVFEGGKLNYEPTEVTYRNITYYYNQAIADITKTASLPIADSIESESSTGDGSGETDEEKRQASGSLHWALAEWIAATNARDIGRQISFYTPRVDAYYRVRDVSREFVRADKSRVFQKADVIDVRAGEPEIRTTPDGRAATMRFRKQYVIQGEGQDRRGEVVQELRWRLTEVGWKIFSERDVKVIR
jgi:YD repeat-containing protein